MTLSSWDENDPLYTPRSLPFHANAMLLSDRDNYVMSAATRRRRRVAKRCGTTAVAHKKVCKLHPGSTVTRSGHRFKITAIRRNPKTNKRVYKMRRVGAAVHKRVVHRRRPVVHRRRPVVHRRRPVVHRRKAVVHRGTTAVSHKRVCKLHAGSVVVRGGLKYKITSIRRHPVTGKRMYRMKRF